jgi:protein-S-isoprenylcysteine O-methyltransferase Ste14
VRASIRSTSTRVFLLVPAVIAIEQAQARRQVRLKWSPLLAAGYLSYRLSGNHRLPRAGGPPGMSQGMPERIVESGPYALTRNPMYLGHLIFLTGLTLATRSPLAAAIAGFHLAWFRERVQRDEQRLRDRFGTAYVDYCARVPRWLPGSPPQ